MPENELQATLQQCSLHSLLMLSSKVLTRSGFGDVQILDRRQSHQKSRYGGYEMLCEASMGTLPVRVAVKVIRDGVRVRMLDEVVGATLRTNMDRCIIISPFHVTKKAKKQLEAYKHIRVDVFDGAALSALLSKYQIGVRSRGTVDYAFFTALEEVSDRLLTFMKENES